jgi:hypothetical protein
VAPCFLIVAACGDDPVDVPPLVVDAPEKLVQLLERVYRDQDSASFASLLAHEPAANAEFHFTLRSSQGVEQELWGFVEESQLHERMFDPESIPATDPALLPQLWVRSIAVTFRRATEFVEPDGIYQDQGNPNGLDRQRWRATQASYFSDARFELENGSFFTVRDEEVLFLVIEDLQKAVGDEGKFLLLRWEDRCSTAPAPAIAGEDCWNTIKSLYLAV